MKKYLKYAISILILVTFVIFIIIYYTNNDDINIENEEIIKKENTKKEIKEEYIFVDIKGAIKCEGVYKLSENSRVIDVINAAGGLKEDADTFNINLSKKVSDEMFIIIYTKEEINKYKSKTLSTVTINNNLLKEIPDIDEANDAQIKTNSTSKININTCSKEDLLKIPGIGESKAENIIKYRNENGKFNSIEDIKKVSGIGESIFEKIKDNITI